MMIKIIKRFLFVFLIRRERKYTDRSLHCSMFDHSEAQGADGRLLDADTIDMGASVTLNSKDLLLVADRDRNTIVRASDSSLYSRSANKGRRSQTRVDAYTKQPRENYYLGKLITPPSSADRSSQKSSLGPSPRVSKNAHLPCLLFNDNNARYERRAVADRERRVRDAGNGRKDVSHTVSVSGKCNQMTVDDNLVLSGGVEFREGNVLSQY